MSILREYVATLSDNTTRKIIDDYVAFEQNGTIGESSLRFYTKHFLDEFDIPESNITVWMTMLAHECYRVFANRYLEENPR